MTEELPPWSAMLAGHHADVAALARELRSAALAALPDLTERYYPGWQGLGLRHPRAGLVATLFARDDEVVVYFERGASLPDPLGLLGGQERLRRTRTITFRPAGPAPGADALITYLDLAVDHAQAARPKAGRGGSRA
jgi:hypothetical protein